MAGFLDHSQGDRVFASGETRTKITLLISASENGGFMQRWMRSETRRRSRLTSLTGRLRASKSALLLGLSAGLGLAAGGCIWLFQRGIHVFHEIFAQFLAHDALGSFMGPVGIIVALALAGMIVGF